MSSTKLKARPKVVWPPSPRARTKRDRTTPGGNHGSAVLQDVLPLNPQEQDVVEIRVTLAGRAEEWDVRVKDPSTRTPLSEFLKKQIVKTLDEIGEITVNF